MTTLYGGIKVTDTNPVLINPANIPVPSLPPLPDQPPATLGTLFPQAATPFYLNVNTYLNGSTPYVPSTGIIDPQSPTLKADIQEYATQVWLQQNGIAGQLTSGCTYSVAYFGMNNSEGCPGPGVGCPPNMQSYTPQQPANVLMFSGTVTTIPGITNVGFTDTNPFSRCYGCTFVDYRVIPNTGISGPFFSGLITDVQGIVTGQSCPGSGGLFTPLMPIAAPPPITFPPGIPLPQVPTAAPPPVISGGTVTTAPPGVAGTINFVPGPNGTQIANIAMPNCTCQDGKTPTFYVRSYKTADIPIPTVTLTQTSPNDYAFDFIFPLSTLPLLKMSVKLPIHNAQGIIEGKDIGMYVPQDGTNDMGTLFQGLFLMLMDINNKLPEPPDPVENLDLNNST